MRIVMSTFLTLDGVMQAPGDPQEDIEGGFEQGGWQGQYSGAEEGKVVGEHMAATDALLLGRKTYQILAAYFSKAPVDDPIAKKLNSIPKYVVSTTLDTVEWHNSTLIKGNVAQEVARLKRQPGSGMLLVIGSGKLAQTLMQHNLVDEYVLWIHPLVLGRGKRLLAEGISPLKFKLVDSKPTVSGVVILTYQPVTM